jgi:hypothetical protein
VLQASATSAAMARSPGVAAADEARHVYDRDFIGVDRRRLFVNLFREIGHRVCSCSAGHGMLSFASPGHEI